MNALAGRLAKFHTTLVQTANRLLPETLLLLAARLSVAAIFWRSGRTKVEGLFTISDAAVSLFAEEYQLPLLNPLLAATLAAVAEHSLPILLVLGLCTRYAAAGLLGMTLVIQIFVYPDAWPTHLSWMTLVALNLAKGPGSWSLDAWLGPRLFRAV
jgi:putative oxidoreductase